MSGVNGGLHEMCNYCFTQIDYPYWKCQVCVNFHTCQECYIEMHPFPDLDDHLGAHELQMILDPNEEEPDYYGEWDDSDEEESEEEESDLELNVEDAIGGTHLGNDLSPAGHTTEVVSGETTQDESEDTDEDDFPVPLNSSPDASFSSEVDANANNAHQVVNKKKD